MSTNIFYLSEGETEQCLQKALPLMGRTIKFNMWTQRYAKIARRINGTIFVIFDTDAIDEIKFNCFKNNVAELKKCGFNVKYLQQTSNLEEELVYASKVKKIDDLIKHFDAKGKSDLKSKIITSTNLLEKLTQIEFNAEKLWERDTNSVLKALNLQRASYKDLPKTPNS